MKGHSLLEAMIILPTSLVVIYTLIYTIIEQRLNRQHICSIILSFIIIVLVSLSVSMKYAHSLGFECIANSMKISPEVKEICNRIGSDYSLLPKDILGQINEYDSGVSAVPFAEISKEGAALDETKANAVAHTAINEGCSTVVIKKAYDDQEVFTSLQYQRTAETEHYVIYQRSE